MKKVQACKRYVGELNISKTVGINSKKETSMKREGQ
jgi:hypothetical protein